MLPVNPVFSLARQHNWLIFSIINPALRRAIAQYAKGKMLDIGCGEKPYQAMAKPHVTLHTGVDRDDNRGNQSSVDVLATACAIPLASSSYETILCTDVLEHLEDPELALREARRLLVSGGYAIYTVPLFWHLHEEPRDFYRFTKHGLRHLFEKSGFELVEINALSGFSATFAQELVYFLYTFRRGGMLNPLWWIVPPVGHLIQAVGYLFNKIERNAMFTCEYLVVARRP
jgi:ubiquinone/menaquinone biosynthesis C-methylase UbiE